MLRLFQVLPPLTKRYNQNPVQYGDKDGLAAQGFYSPEHKYLGWQVVPPDNKLQNGTRSFMAPPSHIHLLQDEIFTVTSGKGIWYSRGNEPRHLKKGETVVIPKWSPHSFENVPGSKEPLVFDYNYNSSMREMEMRFFYNVLSYLDDCVRAEMEPSVFQLCVFLADCWMPLDLKIPGSKWLNLVLSTLFTFVCGAIGFFVLGYKRSYPEYYRQGALGFEKKSR